MKRREFLETASATTIVCLLVGIWVAAYLTVPPIHLTSEGDPMVVFDPEIGMVPNRSAHTRRIYPAIKDRATFVFDVYTDDRGARVDEPGRRSAGRTDIMTIGCSFSWGYALPNGDTYSSRLSKALGASVVNLSEASYGTVQALQMAVARWIMSTAGPVVPTGKKMSGSESRQADSSLQSVTVSTKGTPWSYQVGRMRPARSDAAVASGIWVS